MRPVRLQSHCACFHGQSIPAQFDKNMVQQHSEVLHEEYEEVSQDSQFLIEEKFSFLKYFNADRGEIGWLRGFFGISKMAWKLYLTIATIHSTFHKKVKFFKA